MTDAAPTLFDRSHAAPPVQPSSPAPAPVSPIVEASWTPQERRAHQMQEPGQPAAAVPKIRVGDGEFTATELQEAVAAKALETSRKLTLPQSPDAYEIRLPDQFVPPEGVTFEFNNDDPLLARAREVAHARGIDQEGFSELLGIYAGAQVQDQATVKAARDAEVAKLGPAGPARVDAVLNWTKGMVGVPAAQALSQMLVTAAHVQAFESLMKKFSSQGAGGFSQQHRDQPDGRMSNEEYERLSYEEKREYSLTGKRPG
jgi:hypothetical protein